MNYTIRHRMKGRIRLHVPALAAAAALADEVLPWLRAQDGIKGVRVNPGCASVVIDYHEERRASIDALLAGLRMLSMRDVRRLVAGAAKQAAAAPAPPAGGTTLAMPTVALALAFSANPLAIGINVPLMLWNAKPIAQRAWGVWHRERRLNVDFLDTLAVSASVLQGLLVTGAIITWLVRLGDWIRDMTAAGSRRAISELMEFQARSAWKLVDGAVVAVPARELAAGDLVVVYPGEMIAVDGEVAEGSALVEQKVITGESLPVLRGPGEAVFAATVLREGQITIRTTRVGEATAAGQIAQLVDAAPVGDTRMQNHAERFADRLVAPTLGLAVAASAVAADFSKFLSLVIIDYGTGIRVAAPTSVLSSMTHAARSGIVIKSGGHMERLAEVDTIVFDKTGTLTRGVPAVVEVLTYGNRVSADDLLGQAVAAETRLKHPVAEALRARAAELGVEVPECDATEYHIGMGVHGQVNGYYLHIGSERFMRHNQIRVQQSLADRARFDEDGLSCLYVAIDGTLAGLIAYADQIRPETPAVIARLHALGVRETIMLTGDNAVVARAVGTRLGLTRQYADMLPTDKADVITQLKSEGRVVAMVGDGINDSVALTYADVGIAMRHGPDITQESAHVILMEDSLWKLVQSVEISRQAVRLIKQNYGIVAALNTMALGLALPGGLVTPTATAVLSNGSAILASLNGVRPLLR